MSFIKIFTHTWLLGYLLLGTAYQYYHLSAHSQFQVTDFPQVTTLKTSTVHTLLDCTLYKLSFGFTGALTPPADGDHESTGWVAGTESELPGFGQGHFSNSRAPPLL
ncbi:MAG: hypothetical protein K9N34_09525 [Candidatus Marinimicrobia bacterium]|nr:hypothetical protein [Candidatus Neomarinimicrobiota bacterium]MCF7840819.1 hypothetical protein [Candidatus Neomarinimicrobiota bacterium]